MPRLPSLEGLRKYREEFKKKLKREPSDRLVAIVKESLENGELARKEQQKEIKKSAVSRDEVDR